MSRLTRLQSWIYHYPADIPNLYKDRLIMIYKQLRTSVEQLILQYKAHLDIIFYTYDIEIEGKLYNQSIITNLLHWLKNRNYDMIENISNLDHISIIYEYNRDDLINSISSISIDNFRLDAFQPLLELYYKDMSYLKTVYLPSWVGDFGWSNHQLVSMVYFRTPRFLEGDVPEHIRMGILLHPYYKGCVIQVPESSSLKPTLIICPWEYLENLITTIDFDCSNQWISIFKKHLLVMNSVTEDTLPYI